MGQDASHTCRHLLPVQRDLVPRAGEGLEGLPESSVFQAAAPLTRGRVGQRSEARFQAVRCAGHLPPVPRREGGIERPETFSGGVEKGVE